MQRINGDLFCRPVFAFTVQAERGAQCCGQCRKGAHRECQREAQITRQVGRGAGHTAKMPGAVFRAVAVIGLNVSASPTPTSSVGRMNQAEVRHIQARGEQCSGKTDTVYARLERRRCPLARRRQDNMNPS